MKRYNIRDNRGSGPIKTRVIDFIINDDGTCELEVKDGKMKNAFFMKIFNSKLLSQHKI